jgi:hypothetical protein
MGWVGFLYRCECDGFCGTYDPCFAAGAHEIMRITYACNTSLDYQPEASAAVSAVGGTGGIRGAARGVWQPEGADHHTRDLSALVSLHTICTRSLIHGLYM